MTDNVETKPPIKKQLPILVKKQLPTLVKKIAIKKEQNSTTNGPPPPIPKYNLPLSPKHNNTKTKIDEDGDEEEDEEEEENQKEIQIKIGKSPRKIESPRKVESPRKDEPLKTPKKILPTLPTKSNEMKEITKDIGKKIPPTLPPKVSSNNDLPKPPPLLSSVNTTHVEQPVKVLPRTSNNDQKGESPRDQPLESPKDPLKKTVTYNAYKPSKKSNDFLNRASNDNINNNRTSNDNNNNIRTSNDNNNISELTELKLEDTPINHVDPEKPQRMVPKLPEKSKKVVPPVPEKIETKKCPRCNTIYRGKQQSTCPKCGGGETKPEQGSVSPKLESDPNVFEPTEKKITGKLLKLVEISEMESHKKNMGGSNTILSVQTLRQTTMRKQQFKKTFVAKNYVEKWEDLIKKKEIKERYTNYLGVFRTFLSVLKVPPIDSVEILNIVEKSKNNFLINEGDEMLLSNITEVTSNILRADSVLNGVLRLQSIIREFLCRSKYIRARKAYQLNPSLYERNKIFISLMKKERIYFNQITITNREFVVPLVDGKAWKHGLLSKEDATTLFSNLKEIVSLHKVLGAELTQIEERFPLVDDVGTLLIKIAPHLKVYGEYVYNFKTASDVLMKNLDNNKKFQIWVTEKEQLHSSALMELSLRSLLSLPINHLNTYQYHLKLLTDSTPPTHTGYKDLESAFRTIDAVTVFIGEQLASSSNRAKIIDIQKKVIFPKNYNINFSNKLLCKEKFFIFWKKKKIEALCLLFNKILIIAKQKKNDNLSVKHEINMETLEVVDELLPGGEMEKKGFSSCIISYTDDVVNPENKNVQRIIFYHEKVNVKNSWTDSLRSALNNCQKDRVFGKPLADILNRQDTISGIPFIVKNCVDALMKDNKVASEGIFRISGNKEAIDEIRSKLDKGPQEEQQKRVNFENLNIHDLTGTLKLYFRMLPETLFTFAMYPRFMQLFDEQQFNEEELFGQTASLLKNYLPKQNLPLVMYMFNFFASVTSFSSVNMMKPSNLAIVFAPNFIRPQEETIEYSLKVTRVNRMFELLIIHNDRLQTILKNN
eukprot:TRINITY_DN1054_c2_g1_i2.p1 TRINITY_DN1054_c2_g1~~TRINITY_DN1054_c2_g1_i2.p1  ORF type:complete len:1053 (-),score=324.55 TRINITY_DN1054_c2_g1_i2:49-3207(-)